LVSRVRKSQRDRVYTWCIIIEQWRWMTSLVNETVCIVCQLANFGVYRWSCKCERRWNFSMKCKIHNVSIMNRHECEISRMMLNFYFPIIYALKGFKKKVQEYEFIINIAAHKKTIDFRLHRVCSHNGRG